MTPFFVWVSPFCVRGQISCRCAGNLWPKQYRLLACDKLQAVQDSESRSRFVPQRQSLRMSATLLHGTSIRRPNPTSTPAIPMTTPSDISDTSEEALAVQLECLRRMTPHERLRRACAWSGQVRQMAFDAIRRRHPEFSEEDVRLKFIELTYGEQLADDIRVWLRK